MPVAKRNILDNRHRTAFLPELDDEIKRTKIDLMPKLAPGNPSRDKRIVQACADDPFEFIFGGWVRTFDNHDYKNPFKPFPDEPDLREALAFIHSDEPVACIAKSRQLMVTWLMCAYSVWLARFHPAQAVYIQCKKEDDAKTLVYEGEWLTSRCGFIEYGMHPWLWQSHDGRYTQAKAGKILYANGSSITGIPAGAHHLRSRVGSLVFIDEACFMDDFGDTYQAALAMTKGGGRMRVVSTARYNTFFGELIEATDLLPAA